MTLSAVTLKTSSPAMTKATKYFSAEEETGRVAINTSFFRIRRTPLVENRCRKEFYVDARISHTCFGSPAAVSPDRPSAGSAQVANFVHQAHSARKFILGDVAVMGRLPVSGHAHRPSWIQVVIHPSANRHTVGHFVVIDCKLVWLDARALKALIKRSIGRAHQQVHSGRIIFSPQHTHIGPHQKQVL